MLRIIAGIHRGRRIEAPEGRDTRPTLDRVRENLFNMLQGRCMDARVLDLFAGSGALGLEALSRGAEEAVLCDHDREAARIERKNIQALREEKRARVLTCDWSRAVSLLKGERARFDLIFLDPPYAMTDLREMTEVLLPLLAEDGMMVLEHQAEARIRVTDALEAVRSRSWGYCGVTFFQPEPAGEEESPRTGEERKEAKE